MNGFRTTISIFLIPNAKYVYLVRDMQVSVWPLLIRVDKFFCLDMCKWLDLWTETCFTSSLFCKTCYSSSKFKTYKYFLFLAKHCDPDTNLYVMWSFVRVTEVLWYSPDSNVTAITQATILYIGFDNVKSLPHLTGGQWINILWRAWLSSHDQSGCGFLLEVGSIGRSDR